MKKPELIGLLMKAAGSQIGIAVSTNDPDRLRQKLYALKKTDPTFANLSLIISKQNPDKELFIAKKAES
jgi:hypothetical protein